MPFVASLIEPLNTTNFVLVLIAALLLGPGIPLALLYASKWWVSKIPDTPMLAERIPVEVSNDVVLRDGEPFAMAETDLIQPVPGLAGGTRKLTVQGVTLTVDDGPQPVRRGYVTRRRRRFGQHGLGAARIRPKRTSRGAAAGGAQQVGGAARSRRTREHRGGAAAGRRAHRHRDARTTLRRRRAPITRATQRVAVARGAARAWPSATREPGQGVSPFGEAVPACCRMPCRTGDRITRSQSRAGAQRPRPRV